MTLYQRLRSPTSTAEFNLWKDVLGRVITCSKPLGYCWVTLTEYRGGIHETLSEHVGNEINNI